MFFFDDEKPVNKIVVTTYGKDNIIEKVSISLFDDSSNAENNANYYCSTINSLDLEGNSWVYAKVI